MYTLYKLYPLSNPLDIRYIGQTVAPIERRLIQHKSSAKQAMKKVEKRSYLYNWIHNNNYEIGIDTIEQGITEAEIADKREVELIKEYKGKGYRLVNTTEGGSGAKGLSYTKNGKSVKIIQYSIEGEFIKIHGCMKQAGEETGVKAALISGNIRQERIKSAGGYIWKEWAENYPLKIKSYKEDVEKGKQEGVEKLSKVIYQYTIDGVYMRAWKSMRYLERQTGMFRYNIGLALKSNTFTYGYLWKREKYDKIDPYMKKEKKVKVKRVKPVIYQINRNGEVVGTWNSQEDIAKALDVSTGAISTAVTKGGFRKGYIFSFTKTVDMEKYTKRKVYPKYDLPVYQYGTNGKFIKKWNDISAAAKEVGVFSNTIKEGLSQRVARVGGYQWRKNYSGETIEPYKKPVPKRVAREVIQYTTEMQLVKIWEGVPAIVKETDYLECNIRLAIAGKRIVTAYGYIWKYKGTDIDTIATKVTIRPKRKEATKWAKDSYRDKKGQFRKGYNWNKNSKSVQGK